MKYIITEQQLSTAVKKFKKDDVDRGKLGHIIEKLVLSYFQRTICDVVAIFIPDLDDYIVLILTPDYYGEETTTKIARNIENYIGISTNVIITQSRDCDKMDK